MLFDKITDIEPSFFAWLNQGPLTLTIFLHVIIVLPMVWIYYSEKKKLNS